MHLQILGICDKLDEQKLSSCAGGLSRCPRCSGKMIWAKDRATSATFPHPGECWWEAVCKICSACNCTSPVCTCSQSTRMVFINRNKDMWRATGKRPKLSPITFFTVILNMTSRRPVCFTIKGKGSNPGQLCADASGSAGIKASAWRH